MCFEADYVSWADHCLLDTLRHKYYSYDLDKNWSKLNSNNIRRWLGQLCFTCFYYVEIGFRYGIVATFSYLWLEIWIIRNMFELVMQTWPIRRPVKPVCWWNMYLTGNGSLWWLFQTDIFRKSHINHKHLCYRDAITLSSLVSCQSIRWLSLCEFA